MDERPAPGVKAVGDSQEPSEWIGEDIVVLLVMVGDDGPRGELHHQTVRRVR